MEEWYVKQEAKWRQGGDINNPKVPYNFVRQRGELLYSSVGENLEDSLDRAKKQRQSRTRKKPLKDITIDDQ